MSHTRVSSGPHLERLRSQRDGAQPSEGRAGAAADGARVLFSEAATATWGSAFAVCHAHPASSQTTKHWDDTATTAQCEWQHCSPPRGDTCQALMCGAPRAPAPPRLRAPLVPVLPPRPASATTPGTRHPPGLACGTRGKSRLSGPFQNSKTNFVKALGVGTFPLHL